MYLTALRDPVIRQAELAILPPGDAPLTLLLLSDIHVAGPDMPPERLAKMVKNLNRLDADLVLIAGDLVSDKRVATHIYGTAEAVRPLTEFDAPMGIFVTPGNHDHARPIGDFEAAFTDTNITMLRNETVDAGPIVIAGVDDEFSGHDDIAKTFLQLGDPGKPVITLTHSPDVIPGLPATTSVVVAGHTHCGQIRLPWIGALTFMSRYGDRFACGHVIEGDRHIFIGAGMGTSLLPLRLGAVPDAWLVTLTAKAAT